MIEPVSVAYPLAHIPNAEQATTTLTATATSPSPIATRTAVRTTDTCGCGHVGDCDYPDCMNGAYHGTSIMRFITLEDHHVKPF